MAVPTLGFRLVPDVQGSFPVENNEGYQLLIDQAVSGGSGTRDYLQRMAEFATLTEYLNEHADTAFSTEQLPGGGMQAVATDGTATMNVAVQLNPDLAETQLNGQPVRGMATVRLALPQPTQIAEFASFGLSLAEIPASIVVTDALIAALFKPLLRQLTGYVQSTVESWLEVEVGEDIAVLGDELAAVAGETAEEIGAETAELVVEEVVIAEIAIDLSVAVPAFAALALLVAVPILISALAKQFQIHLEIDNQTNSDFTWSTPYVYNGAMTAQPAQQVLPRMGRATDAWGDVTDVPVVYQANFSTMNKSGYRGTGIALQLSPQDVAGQDLAVLISIPWAADNALWIGDVTPGMNWQKAFDDYPEAALRVSHGNSKFYATLAIDALSGNDDDYHGVLRIQPL